MTQGFRTRNALHHPPLSQHRPIEPSRRFVLLALAVIFAGWCLAGYIDAGIERDQELARTQARLARCEQAKTPAAARLIIAGETIHHPDRHIARTW